MTPKPGSSEARYQPQQPHTSDGTDTTPMTPRHTFFALESNVSSVREVLAQCATTEGRGGALQLVGPTDTPHLLPYLPDQLGLAGSHQRDNALLAVALVQDLLGSPTSSFGGPITSSTEDDHPLTAWHQALSLVSWPGRCQTVEVSPTLTLYIDGAHTVQSIHVAVDWFQDKTVSSSSSSAGQQKDRRALLFYCSHEKNPIELMQELLRTTRHGDGGVQLLFDVVCFCPPTAQRPSTMTPPSARQLLQTMVGGDPPTDDTHTGPDNTNTTEEAATWQETLQIVWKHLEQHALKSTGAVPTTTACLDSVTEALAFVQQQEQQHQTQQPTLDSVPWNESTKWHVMATGSLYLAGSVLEAVGWTEEDAPDTGRV